MISPDAPRGGSPCPKRPSSEALQNPHKSLVELLQKKNPAEPFNFTKKKSLSKPSHIQTRSKPFAERVLNTTILNTQEAKEGSECPNQLKTLFHDIKKPQTNPVYVEPPKRGSWDEGSGASPKPLNPKPCYGGKAGTCSYPSSILGDLMDS